MTGVLEGNTGIVSALAFSPDGKLLASGDVRVLYFPLWSLFLCSAQSKGRIVLFDVKEKKVSIHSRVHVYCQLTYHAVNHLPLDKSHSTHQLYFLDIGLSTLRFCIT